MPTAFAIATAYAPSQMYDSLYNVKKSSLNAINSIKIIVIHLRNRFDALLYSSSSEELAAVVVVEIISVVTFIVIFINLHATEESIKPSKCHLSLAMF